MSNPVTDAAAPTATLSVRPEGSRRSRLPSIATMIRVVLVVVVAILPIYLDQSFLQTGLFAMAAILGAIGLTILTGSAGQLSLAHAFFLAIGAYGYSYFAGASGGAGSASAVGLGLPSALAMVLAVLAAGVAGLLFSPISGRLRGIYLGVASLSLVFIGSFALENFRSITGGFNGRAVPDLSLFGFTFADANPPLTVLNVPYGRFERLWYLSLVLVVLGYIFAKNILRGRPGRAMQTLRDSEVAAAVMGVNVRLTKAGAFVLSSMYAGLAGVLLALVFTHVVPDYFNLALSVSYLAMVVIGGLGSVGGAALGAVFVSALPQLLTRYSGSVPFVAQPGQGGYDPGVVSALLYGVAVIVVVVFAPGGLAALSRRFAARRPNRSVTTVADAVP